MRKQTAILILACLVLGTIYIVKFTDWFGQKSIQILFTVRRGNAVFGLDGKHFKLTSIKVYQAGEIATNKYAHPLWHLITDSNSVPTTDFPYGATIPGMKPAVPGTAAEPLQRSVNYKILIEAGKNKGEREFKIQ